MGSTPAGAGPTGRRAAPGCSVTEHPRRRGADGGWRAVKFLVRGAPPQARGRRRPLRLTRCHRRSTPAGAGPTPAAPFPSASRPEHPRRRGADCGPVDQQGRRHGAPPQARGRLRPHHPEAARPRSTPAGAGSTREHEARIAREEEHPRRRGADRPVMPPPPHPPRSTPAGAGPTGRRARCARASTEHPRRRGADCRARRPAAGSAGAPPQARGRRGYPLSEPPLPRSTPAGAGPTAAPRPATPADGEHPRRRGVDVTFTARPWSWIGAPPQARGRRREAGGPLGGGGSTPAGAGPTTPTPAGPGSTAEHPRRRGADCAPTTPASLIRGAPPQARGRLRAPGSAAIRSRSTPAGAGPTCPRRRRSSTRAEHPRRRGADPEGMSWKQGDTGAPPQARGRPTAWAPFVLPQRSTPAGAGPTG